MFLSREMGTLLMLKICFKTLKAQKNEKKKNKKNRMNQLKEISSGLDCHILVKKETR